MNGDISDKAKEALANAETFRRRNRLNRDGCSKNDAVERRLNYIAAERKIASAKITKITARRLRLDDLAAFAKRHGLSLDWLMFGDIATHPRFVQKAQATEEDWAHMFQTFGKLDRNARATLGS
jgi:hypothetical protein